MAQREHKFRVWCEYEIEGRQYKEMAGPENWFLMDQVGHLMSHGPMTFDPNAEMKYKVLIPEFYTGLKDRSGKEIYEGDKVRLNDKIGIVIWNEQNAVFIIIGGEFYDYMGSKFDWSDLEVIGDIHSSPELLKE